MPPPGPGKMVEIDLRFAFDYVDPGSYLAFKLLERRVPSLPVPVRMTWIHLELRVPWSAPIDADEVGWSEMTGLIRDHARIERIPFSTPTQIPRTRKAHELALHAKEKGCFEPVHLALFEAHFQDGLDIGRIDVLVGIGAESGLDRSEARTVLGVDRFSATVDSLRAEALGQGIRGVPTIIGPNGAAEGFHGPESLLDFIDVLPNGERGSNPAP